VCVAICRNILIEADTAIISPLSAPLLPAY